MRKILNRGAKRRLRRKQQSARRTRSRSLIRGMEPLEDRRLLAVTADDNFVQLFNPGGGVTQTVQGKITVLNGPDAAIALALNYTDTTALTIEVDLDNDGAFDDLSYIETQIKLGAGNVNNAEGLRVAQTLAGGAIGEINSAVFVIPVGLANPLDAAMDRVIGVRVTGGPSTDILGTFGSYHGVDQNDPLFNALSAKSSAIAGETAISLGNPVAAGNRTLDAVMALERTNAGGPIAITLKPDRLDSDPSEGDPDKDQIDVLNVKSMPAPNAVVHGAASTDDDDLSPANKHDMNWGFLQAGAAAFTHVAAQINMAAKEQEVFYDGGDADKSYGIAIHAPKGPTIGAAGGAETRDKELLSQIILNQSVDADGDDINVTDDEEIGPADFGNTGALNGMFVSKSMGFNEATLKFDVDLVDGPDADQLDDPAYVTVYIDWGRDGSFIDKEDQVLAGVSVKDGTNTFTFNIPDSKTVVAGQTTMRIRIHTASMGEDKTIAWNDMHANDGEVEDVKVILKNASSVHGIKFEDLNGNGVRDPADPPLGGVAFQLFKQDGTTPAKDLFGNEVPIQKSDINGKFWFDNLDIGKYVVKELLNKSDTFSVDTNNDKIPDKGDGIIDYGLSIPAPTFMKDVIDQGLRPSTHPDDDFDGISDKGVEIEITKQGQNKDLPQEFGNFIAGSIHGFKFHDIDGDGVKDSNEPALEGIKFDLYKFKSTSKTVTFSGKTTVKYTWTYHGQSDPTNVHGEFWFDGLAPGIYELFEQEKSANNSMQMEFVVSTGQQQAKTTDTASKDHPLMILMGRNPSTSNTAFEIVSRREFVYKEGAASSPIDGLGDNVAGKSPDKLLQAGEIEYGKIKAALKKEVLASAVPTTIVNSKGFEIAAGYVPGNLEGQPAGAPFGDEWLRAAPFGSSTAVVQDKIFAGGGPVGQAVQVNRGANSSDHWGVPVVGFPLTNMICIEWDMRVEDTKEGLGEFGPFFGVEAYDDSDGPILVLGALGVDAATGEVLYQRADDPNTPQNEDGVLTVAGTVTFGEFHRFRMELDYDKQSYSIFVDSKLLVSGIEFIDKELGVGGVLNAFTDAAITATGAAPDKGSMALTGTAYFDNFTVDDCGTGAGNSLIYGNYKPIDIHGFKYHDVDGNGKYEPANGDTLMANITMLLEGKDGKGNPVSLKAVTEAVAKGDNNFWFTDLPPGVYTISEDPNTKALGDTNKLDKDEGLVIDTDVTTVNATSGQLIDLNKADNDGDSVKEVTNPQQFRNFISGSIHGLKFHDLNADGNRANDKDDPNLGNITFRLYRRPIGNTGAFTEVAKVTTGDNGQINFTGLQPGEYVVRELSGDNAGWIISTGQSNKAPGDGALPSDGIVLKSGQEYGWDGNPPNSKLQTDNKAPQLLFGDYRTATINGIKYEDLNDDGDKDPEDPVMPNVWMIIKEKGKDPILGASLTDKDGKFSFTGLMPGKEYVVSESTSTTLGSKLDQLGTDTNADGIPDIFQGLIVGDDTFESPSLKSNQEVTAPTNTFGNFILGSIHGIKFHDENGNGILDGDGIINGAPGDSKTDEDPLPGVKFHLWKLVGSTTTHFPSGKATTTYEWKPEQWTTTNSHGEFWFTDLTHGTYEVFEEPDDYKLTTGQPTDMPVLVVPDNPNTKDVDESKWLGKAPSANSFVIESRLEYVWELDPTLEKLRDKDGNLPGGRGSDTPEELKALLDSQYGAFNRPMDFNNNGKIDGQPADVTKDPIVPPTGEFLDSYSKAALKIQVLADGPLPGKKNLIYGNIFLSSIHGFKYEDLNGDGEFDKSDDVPMKDVWMVLENDKGEIVDATLTGADGKFWFDKVLPGSYTVRESDSLVIGSKLNQLATDTNHDKVADLLQELVIDTTEEGVTVKSQLNPADRDVNLKHEWGNYVLGSIHGVKFQDYNRNGRWDRESYLHELAEPAWKDIIFDLYRLTHVEDKLLVSNKVVTEYTWEKIAEAKTDLHGEFWFTGLEPGWYEVVERANPNYEQTTKQPTQAPGKLSNPEVSKTALEIESRLEFVWELDPTLDKLRDKNGNLPGGPGSDTTAEQDALKDTTFGAFNRPMDGAVQDATGKFVHDPTKVDGIIDPAERSAAYNKAALKIEVLASPEIDPEDDFENGIQKNADLWFGNNFITGSIHGFKFEDTDADGIYDQKSPKGIPGGEPGLAGILIQLVDVKTGEVPLLANGKLARTRTALDGRFWFTDVMPGTYNVQEVLDVTKDGKFTDSNGDGINDYEQGMVASTPTTTGPFVVLPKQEWVYTPGAAMLTKQQIANGVTEKFEDNGGASNINEKLIFGNYIQGSIHGFKFLDTDADGVYEPEHWQDMPFEWGAFDLLDSKGRVDLNKDGKIDDINDVVYTDLAGEFWFTDLKPGTYTVRERPELIDRNDVDGDGFPDIEDSNGDGLPDKKGNGTPDDQEGLKISTHKQMTLQIWSGEEIVWKPGAANLDKVDAVVIDPDDHQVKNNPSAPVNIGTAIPNVTLTSLHDFDIQLPIFSEEPFFPVPDHAETGDFSNRAFTHITPFGDSNPDTYGFWGNEGILQADFDVPVRSVSVWAIGADGNDRGVLIAYDIDGNVLDTDSTKLLGKGQYDLMEVSVPLNSAPIAFIQVAGDGNSASLVGLYHMEFSVDSLKEEKLAGNGGRDLMWGDYYSGAIHGLKWQQDSNNPAPRIPIQLVDQWGVPVIVDKNGKVDPAGGFNHVLTNDKGEFWFTDVKPGFYTVNEVPTSAIIVMAQPIPVVVGHAQAIFASNIPPADQMYYEGLQTPISNHALTLRNLIEGSIHGLVCDQNNQPLAGVTVNLVGPENGQATTGADGSFHFKNLTPGAYVVNVNGILRIVVVGSGEEEVAMAGLAGAPGPNGLQPGQFETLNPQLKFIIQSTNPDTTGPRVASVKVVSSQWVEDFLDEVDPVDGEGYPVPTGPDQFKTLPWININEVLVEFTEPMNITAADISLHGVTVPNYGTTFAYDNATNTARLQLTGGAFINADKLVLHVNDTAKDKAGNSLDGEWVNGVSTFANGMGNGTPGGDFNFRINVLPGDSRQDGHNLGQFDGVLGTDVVKVRNAQFLTTADAAYSAFDDVNGNAAVQGTDVVAVRNRQFTGLPAGNPVAPAGSGASLGEDDVDSVFGDGSAVFGKSAVAGDAGDDSLLLALAGSSGSSSDSAFESSDSDDGDGGELAAVGSIDDLFAALGS